MATEKKIEVEVPHTLSDWKDFGERVLRAAYTGAIAAASAIPVADLLDGGLNGEGVSLTWKHLVATIATGALTAAWTAIKAGIGQGRGSDPRTGSLK